MKRFIFFLVIFFTSAHIKAQSTERWPTRSRFYNNRYQSFSLNNGNILVYKLVKDTSSYFLIVTVKEYANAIYLDYSMNGADSSNNLGSAFYAGKINIPEKPKNEAYKYDTLITDSIATLKDEIVFWMSKKNYSELYYVKESLMDLGNKIETFERKNTSVIKIKIMGRETFLTLFNMQNRGEKPRRDIAILTDYKNPLIAKMDVGKWKMELVEIR